MDPTGCAAPREFFIEITPKDNGEVISSGPCNVGSVLGVCAPPFLSKNTATHFLCEMLRFAFLTIKTRRFFQNQNLRFAFYSENSSSPRRRLNHFPRNFAARIFLNHAPRQRRSNHARVLLDHAPEQNPTFSRKNIAPLFLCEMLLCALLHKKIGSPCASHLKFHSLRRWLFLLKILTPHFLSKNTQ